MHKTGLKYKELKIVPVDVRRLAGGGGGGGGGGRRGWEEERAGDDNNTTEVLSRLRHFDQRPAIRLTLFVVGWLGPPGPPCSRFARWLTDEAC